MHPPVSGQMPEARGRCEAGGSPDRERTRPPLDRLLGHDRAARVHVRALRGGLGREGGHGARHAVALMRGEPAVPRGDRAAHQ
jgi:hypothetical protein